MCKKALKKISGAILPELGAVGGAVNGLVQGEGLEGAVKGGVQGGLKAAGSIAGAQFGANVLPQTIGSTLGMKSSSNIFGSFLDKGLGSTVGSFAGNAAGDALSNSLGMSMGAEDDAKTDGVTPFSPSRSAQLELPGGISGFSGLTPEQQSSNIATQGTYGGGLGKEEQAYFTNLINRRLIDDSGNVDADLSEVNPIEQSYLAQIGLGGNSNPRSLLEAISKWKAA